MRRLAALALVLAAIVAALMLATGDAPHPGGAVAPTGSAAPTARDTGAPAEIRRQSGERPATTSTAVEDATGSERRPARTPSLEIAGVVRFDDGEPAPQAIVGLFAPATGLDNDHSPFAAQELRDRPGAEALRLVHAWTRTDAAGRFRFEFPDPGRWIVRADLGPLLAAATPLFAVEAGMSRTDLVLRLPPAAWLEGRLIVPEGAAFDSVCLELRSNVSSTLGRWMLRVDVPEVALRCMPAADGSFRLGPTEVGVHTVGLVLDSNLRTRARPATSNGQVVSLLDLYLPAGETRREIDLRAGFPGSIALTVNVHLTAALAQGVSPASGQMRVWAEPIASQRRNDVVSGFFRTGVPVELGPLPPGNWRVLVQLPRLGPWSWPVSESLYVGPAERVERTLDLEIASAVVELVDARTGEPLDSGSVEVGRVETDGVTSSECALQAPGRVALSLPPGDYMVTAREEGLESLADDPRAWARLTWNASGPSDRVLRVPR